VIIVERPEFPKKEKEDKANEKRALSVLDTWKGD
jgi:hypothetical protein